MVAAREVFARFGVKFDESDFKRADAAANGVAKSLGKVAFAAQRVSKPVSEFAVNQRKSTGAAEAALPAAKGLTVGLGAVAAAAAATAAAVVGATIAFRNWVEATVHQTEELRLTSERLGIGVRELQAWSLGARQAGRDTEDVADAISTLQERARDAIVDPKSDPAQQLRLLSVSAKDASGNLKDGQTLFLDVADALAKMGNQTDRVGAAMTLFGDVGRELLPVLQGGRKGFEDLLRQLDELGGGFDEGAISAGQEFAGSMAMLDIAMASLNAALAKDIIPALATFVGWIARAVGWFSDLMDSTSSFETSLGFLAAALSVFGFVAFSALAPILIPLLAIVAAFGVLFILVEDIVTLFRGGDSLAGRFLDKIFGAGVAAKMVEKVKDAIADVVEWLRVKGPAAWEAFKEVARETIDFILTVVEKLSSGLAGFLDGIRKAAGAIGVELDIDTSGLREIAAGAADFAARVRGPEGTFDMEAQVAEEQGRAFAGSPTFTVPEARAPAAGRGGTTVTQQQVNTFQIRAQDPEGVRREVRSELDRQRRASHEELTEAVD